MWYATQTHEIVGEAQGNGGKRMNVEVFLYTEREKKESERNSRVRVRVRDCNSEHSIQWLAGVVIVIMRA